MTDDPRGFADGEAESLPLSPEDEVMVSAMLSALPDPEIPADVERRIVAAVVAVERDDAPGSPEPDLEDPIYGAGGPPTVTSISRHSGSSPSGPWRRPWMLQAAAVVLVIALVGAVAVGFTRGNGGSDGAASTAADQQLVLSQQVPGPVTTSGTSYSSSDLAAQVTQLVQGSTAPPSPAWANPMSDPSETPTGDSEPKAASAGDGEAATTAQSQGSSALGFKSRGDTTDAEIDQLTTLVEEPVSRQACIDKLASVPGAQAIAIDVGLYDDRPAAVIVLPDEDDPTKIAAWIVGPTCSAKDNPFPYRYERLPRP